MERSGLAKCEWREQWARARRNWNLRRKSGLAHRSTRSYLVLDGFVTSGDSLRSDSITLSPRTRPARDVTGAKKWGAKKNEIWSSSIRSIRRRITHKNVFTRSSRRSPFGRYCFLSLVSISFRTKILWTPRRFSTQSRSTASLFGTVIYNVFSIVPSSCRYCHIVSETVFSPHLSRDNCFLRTLIQWCAECFTFLFFPTNSFYKCWT
jgi:hypothetical protein